MIDELDRVGTADLAPILNLKHQGSVFRFLKNHPDFPRPKKLGPRLSWARGEIIHWIRAQPDRDGGDPEIIQRLQLGRSPRKGAITRAKAKKASAAETATTDEAEAQ